MSLEQTIADLNASVKDQTKVLQSIATSLAVYAAKNNGWVHAPEATEAPAPKAEKPKAKAEPKAAPVEVAEEPELEAEAEEEEPVDKDEPEAEVEEVEAPKAKRAGTGLGESEGEKLAAKLKEEGRTITKEEHLALSRRQRHNTVTPPSTKIDPNNPPPRIVLPKGERTEEYYNEHVRPTLLELARFVAPDGDTVGIKALQDWLVTYQTRKANEVPADRWDEMVNFAEAMLTHLKLEHAPKAEADEVEV